MQGSYKTNDFKLNFSTVKSKTLVFSKERNNHFNSLYEVTNELQLAELVNVITRVVNTGYIKTTNNNLTLKEYIATYDDKSQIKIAMFEQFADQTQLNNTYKTLNLQLVTYLNKRKMRSTTKKINKDIPDLKMKEFPKLD